MGWRWGAASEEWANRKVEKGIRGESHQSMDEPHGKGGKGRQGQPLHADG